MRGTLVLRHGDNIYHRYPQTGCFIQQDSFLSEPAGQLSTPNFHRDTGTTDRVLLAREFACWGAGTAGVGELSEFVHRIKIITAAFQPERAEAFRHMA
jgi:hypothetical protein